MTTTAPTLVEPTQGDRDRAAAFYRKHLARPNEVPVADAMRAGHVDESPLIQAFATHRLSTRSAVVEECAAIAEEAIRSVAPLTTPIASMIEVGTILINLPTAIRKLKESDNAG